MEFPTTPEEFYKLRDDRTQRYVGKRDYQLVRCVVTIDSELTKRFKGQVMLAVTCNLLSRWCRFVEIVLPQDGTFLDARLGDGLLSSFLLRQMKDADPYGDFKVSTRRTVGTHFRLHIGSSIADSSEKFTIINADGWCAALGKPVTRLLGSGSELVIGPIAAACLGVAQLFKRALGFDESLLTEDGLFDLFALKRVGREESPALAPQLNRIELGRVLMVGAGSVGSAAAYCMKLADVLCDLTIVDGDVVKIENFNRSPIFGTGNFGMNKGEAVARSLARTKIKADFSPGWWVKFVAQRGSLKNKFDIWLPLANEHGVRWSMQQNLPPLLIHASTGFNWNVNHGRHIPGRHDCLADRFPNEVTKEVLACSTAAVPVEGATVDAALPFLSTFAGLLVTSELIRLELPGYPQVPNFALIDFMGPMSSIQLWDRTARPECSCRTLSPRIYANFNGASKYSHLAFSHAGHFDLLPQN